MNILFEDSMPYAQHYFSSLGDAIAFPSGQLRAEQLVDVDALLVRSTTKVDQSLLRYAERLQFVATATSGTDHMDLPLLDQKGLTHGSAAGSNAIAVAEYVISCLLIASNHDPQWLHSICVGIVGAGHVGTTLARKLDALGIAYKLCDPPLQHQGDARTFCDFEAICQCDVISLHVPLEKDSAHPTYHMFDQNRLAALTQDQLLINASRGEVVDNHAALALYRQGKKLNLMLDVWENEPDILFELIPHTLIATPHIAGHTLEGKARGTYMLYQQLCAHLGEPTRLSFESCLPNLPQLDLSHFADASEYKQIRAAILSVYNVQHDSDAFKQKVSHRQAFIYSRKHYAIRREFSSVPVNAGNSPLTEAIYRLGFLPV